MRIFEEAALLRIHISEDARSGHRPLYEDIVLRAREAHLAGATVLRGPMGFGHDSELHTAKVLRLSESLPIIVEIIDTDDRIEAFLAAIEPILTDGVVTVQPVRVKRYGKGRGE